MYCVTIKDKTFELSITADEIQRRIGQLAEEINKDHGGKKPLFIAVLNGSFMFAADLFRRFNGDAEISFVRVSSYSGTQSTGVVKNLMGFGDNLAGRDIILVEDIVDSGDTAIHLMDELKKQNPAGVKFA